MQKWLSVVLSILAVVSLFACSKDEQAEAEKAAAEFAVDISGSYTGTAELTITQDKFPLTAKLRIGPDRKIERLEWQGFRSHGRTDDLQWTPDGSVRFATTFYKWSHGNYQDRDAEFRMERNGAHLEVFVDQPGRMPIQFLQFSYDYNDTEMATIDAGGVFALDPAGECLTTTVRVAFPTISGPSIPPDKFEMGMPSSEIIKRTPGAEQANRTTGQFFGKIVGLKNTTLAKVELSNTPGGRWLVDAVNVDTNSEKRTLGEHPDTSYSITLTEPIVREAVVTFCTDGRKTLEVPDRKIKYELQPGT